MNSVHSLESAEDCSPAASCEERLSDPEQPLLYVYAKFQMSKQLKRPQAYRGKTSYFLFSLVLEVQ